MSDLIDHQAREVSMLTSKAVSSVPKQQTAEPMIQDQFEGHMYLAIG